ncbi:adenosine deaminase [Agromyces sp. MMS24-JH15]|uniref:adenosine deaminase n=1 Tax=Agromyces sp. MMS24-JH15 TaxID=3243765 RepID=UPI003749962C
MPKAEVHVHLEGAIELADLLEAAADADAALPGPAATLFDPSTHRLRPGGSELSTYLEFLDWVGSLYGSRQRLARLAYRFAARQSASGVRYTDVIVNPSHWGAWRHDLPGFFDALASGLDEAEADGLAPVGLCASIERGQTAAEAAELASIIAERRPRRVVALSIDGDEGRHGRTAARFADAFDIARRAGLGRTVHAGESSGPEGVWDALTLLHADRIDHGVRAVEDDRLVAHLAEAGVSLGICPSSNLALGVVDRLGVHPVQRLMESGVVVTINSDDPAPLATSIEAEWAMCAAAFGWDGSTLVDLARASVRASYASAEVRAVLESELDAQAAHAEHAELDRLGATARLLEATP